MNYSPEASDLFIRAKPINYPMLVKDVVLEPGNKKMSDSQFLTRSEVAKMLGVSPNTVTRWAREGRLACLVTLGGHHRFDREVVEQLRKKQYRAPQDQGGGQKV
jgi:excisionase family DNA binding protein